MLQLNEQNNIVINKRQRIYVAVGRRGTLIEVLEVVANPGPCNILIVAAIYYRGRRRDRGSRGGLARVVVDIMMMGV